MGTKTNIYIVNDKLIKLVVNKWSVPPAGIWGITSLCPLLLFAFLSLVFGDFTSHDGVIGYLNNYLFFVHFLLGVPSIMVFYFYTPVYLQQCFDELKANKVFSFPNNSKKKKVHKGFYDFLEKVNKSLSSKWWITISIVISTIFMFFAVPEHFKGKDWIMTHWVTIVLIELFWWVIFSVVVLVCLRILVGIWWINKAFAIFDVRVRPLFPDKVGGLKPLNQYSMRLGWIIFVFGMQISLNHYFTSYVHTGVLGNIQWTRDIIIVWIAYLLLAPIAFFAPIGAAHNAMIEAKNNELLHISREFEKEYHSFKDDLKKPLSLIKRRSGKIEELQKLYSLADDFPIWPFQLQKIAQFFATVLSPLVLTIVSTILASWLPDILN